MAKFFYFRPFAKKCFWSLFRYLFFNFLHLFFIFGFGIFTFSLIPTRITHPAFVLLSLCFYRHFLFTHLQFFFSLLFLTFLSYFSSCSFTMEVMPLLSPVASKKRCTEYEIVQPWAVLDAPDVTLSPPYSSRHVTLANRAALTSHRRIPSFMSSSRVFLPHFFYQ